MKNLGVRVIFDTTHSVQLPGAGPSGTSTGGRREYVDMLSRCAISVGTDGIFMEVHPDPKNAKSDATTCRPLKGIRHQLEIFCKMRDTLSQEPMISPELQID